MRRLTYSLIALPSLALAQPSTLSEVERRAFMSAGVHFVPNAVEQFSALSTRPDALGFYKDGDQVSSPDPSRCKHYQGTVRYQGADDTPYFIVSRSGNTPALPWLPDGVGCGEANTGDDDDPGNLLVIQMGSRDKHGERLRSNRIRRGEEAADTPPDVRDKLVANLTFDGNGWPKYGHPGGMQIVGDVVAVPMETPYAPEDREALILFIDVSEPAAPALVNEFEPHVPGMKAGLLGLTPQSNGKYLMLISGGTNETIWFYESTLNQSNGTPLDPTDDFTDLKAPGLDWTLVDTWTKGADEAFVGADWPIEGGAHQSLTFLREGGLDGTLYVAGARNTVTLQYFGSDHVDLYRIDRTGNDFKLVRVATSHKNTHPNADGSITLPETPLNSGPTTANFATASTFYVSPTGELLFYATEHDNDGPIDSIFGGTIKAGEWRHIDMVRAGSPTRNPTARAEGPFTVDEGSSVTVSGAGGPAISKAWIQLYSDPSYSGRYVVFDYDDRLKDDFDNFKSLDGDLLDARLGFDDIASSWNWYAPEGCAIRANDDDFGDGNFPGTNTRTLPGRGYALRAADLRNICNNANSTNSDGTERDCTGGNGQMENEITSVEFRPDCDVYYSAEPWLAWDMDGDDFPDAYGESAPFSAAALDGPSTRQVPLFAIHPYDGSRGEAFAEVSILNVAPAVSSVVLSDDLGQVIGTDVAFSIAGLDVHLDAAFTDAGKPDTHEAFLTWDDGASQQNAFDQFVDSTGGGLGRVAAHHVYAEGLYEVAVLITDDDGASGEAAAPLEVLSARAALQAVVDEINALIAGTSDPAVVAALISIRNALIGNNNGRANNGALDAYDADRLKESFVKFLSVLIAIESAENALGFDLSDVKNILGLAAKSIVTVVYNDRITLTPSPSGGQLRQLEVMGDAIALGNTLLAQGAYRGAISAYHTAL